MILNKVNKLDKDKETRINYNEGLINNKDCKYTISPWSNCNNIGMSQRTITITQKANSEILSKTENTCLDKIKEKMEKKDGNWIFKESSEKEEEEEQENYPFTELVGDLGDCSEQWYYNSFTEKSTSLLKDSKLKIKEQQKK